MDKDVEERIEAGVKAQIEFHRKTAGAGAGGAIGGYFGARMAKKKGLK